MVSVVVDVSISIVVVEVTVVAEKTIRFRNGGEHSIMCSPNPTLSHW